MIGVNGRQTRPYFAAWYVDELDRLLAQRPTNHVIDDDLEARPLDYYEDFYEGAET